MFVIYAKDEDEKIGCSERYQETEFLGVYSTLELAKEQINIHKINIEERRKDKKKITPRVWEYYIYSCELDQPIIFNEKNVVYTYTNYFISSTLSTS